MTDAVYEPAYEPYDGSRTSRTRRIAAIARRGMAKTARSTWFWVLLGLSLVHIAIRGALLQITGQGDVPGATPFNATFLTGALDLQARWVVTFLLAAIGADVISEDLETGGFTFYFTKPITKPGYVVGKLAAPFSAAFFLTAVPTLVLWLIGVTFTPEALHPDDVWLLPLGLLAGSLVVSAMATLVVAGLSAIVGSRGRTAVVWVAIVFVLSAAARVARAVTRNADTLLIDLYEASDKVNQMLVGAEASPVSGLGAGLTVAGWSLAAAVALAWALTRKEVTG